MLKIRSQIDGQIERQVKWKISLYIYAKLWHLNEKISISNKNTENKDKMFK